jgi:hypothetical protein
MKNIKLPIYSLIALLALSACGPLSVKPSAIDPISDLSHLAANEGIDNAFRHWMDEISAVEGATYKAGASYYIDIPYYEESAGGGYVYPYENEFTAAENAMSALCSVNGFTKGSAKLLSKEPEFIIVDPSTTPNPHPWYWACIKDHAIQNVLVTDSHKTSNRLELTLFTSSDIEAYRSLKREKAIALNDQKKIISLNFKEQLKAGDQTSVGMVIEVKRPLALVQTSNGQTWFDIIMLEPRGLWGW